MKAAATWEMSVMKVFFAVEIGIPTAAFRMNADMNKTT
jgi:hypothetical protein